MNTQVSVIIPTYNRKELLGMAIQSVWGQTYKDVEIIVVDDGSNDGTESFIKEQFGDKVRYYRKPNAGISSARNLGIRNANGGYIAFLDDDDIWLSDKLTLQMQKFSHNPDLGLVYCGVAISSANKRIEPLRYIYPRQRGYIFNKLLESNCIVGSASAVVVKRDCFDKVGYFDESLSASEDYDMWLRICQKYRVDFVIACLVEIHDHSKNMSHSLERMETNEIKVIDKIFNMFSLPNKLVSDKKKYYSLHYLRFSEYYYFCREMKQARRCLFRAFRLHAKNLSLDSLMLYLKSFIVTWIEKCSAGTKTMISLNKVGLK